MNDLEDRLTSLLTRVADAVEIRPDLDAVLGDDGVVMPIDLPARRRGWSAALVGAAAALALVVGAVAVGGNGGDTGLATAPVGGESAVYPVFGVLPEGIDATNAVANADAGFVPYPALLLGRVSGEETTDLVLVQVVESDGGLLQGDNPSWGAPTAVPLRARPDGTDTADRYDGTDGRTTVQFRSGDHGVIVNGRTNQAPLLEAVAGQLTVGDDGQVGLPTAIDGRIGGSDAALFDGYTVIGTVQAGAPRIGYAYVSIPPPTGTDGPELSAEVLSGADEVAALIHDGDIQPFTRTRVAGRPSGWSRTTPSIVFEAAPGVYVRVRGSGLDLAGLHDVAAGLRLVGRDTFIATYEQLISRPLAADTTTYGFVFAD
jgi:hypothetical protein